MTQSSCPVYVMIQAPELTSKHLTVMSLDAVNTLDPSTESVKCLTQSLCPENVARHSPVLVSKHLAVLSSDAVNTLDPSDDSTI